MALPCLFYDNRLADNTVSASSTAAGNFAPDNVADMRPYTWWKPATLPATLTVDCGVTRAADFALIYGHDLHSVGASVEVRKSSDNFVSNDVLVASGTPASDDPYLLTFGSTSERYWRVRITGSTVSSLAIAMIGARFSIPEGLDQGFDPLARRGEGRSNRNENGHPLGRVIDFEAWEQDLSFEFLTWTWLRSTFVPAWEAHLRSTPFAFAWDLDQAPTEIVLVAADGDFQTPHHSGGFANLRFPVKGVHP